MSAEPEFAALRPRRLQRSACNLGLVGPGTKAEIPRSEAEVTPDKAEVARSPAPEITRDHAPEITCSPSLLRPGNQERQTNPPPSGEASEARKLCDGQTACASEDSGAPSALDDNSARASVLEAREQVEMLRAEATRFAAIACARALRVSLVENPATIAQFVDDALRACGRVARARLRLHPTDAAAYRPRRDVDVSADAHLERGEIVIETDSGSVGATLEQRALLLAKAAADA